jgi:hypothetical protein
MTQVEVLDVGRDRTSGYRVDVSRGERVGRPHPGHSLIRLLFP